MLGQLQLLEALKLWDPSQRNVLWKKVMDYESAACLRNCKDNFLPISFLQKCIILNKGEGANEG